LKDSEIARDVLAQTVSVLCLNPLSANRMTAAERLDEIADLLAAGLMRLRARKSSALSRDRGDSSLDFSPDQRGHVSVRDSVGDA
jgi:hypothetical protein